MQFTQFQYNAKTHLYLRFLQRLQQSGSAPYSRVKSAVSNKRPTRDENTDTQHVSSSSIFQPPAKKQRIKIPAGVNSGSVDDAAMPEAGPSKNHSNSP